MHMISGLVLILVVLAIADYDPGAAGSVARAAVGLAALLGLLVVFAAGVLAIYLVLGGR